MCAATTGLSYDRDSKRIATPFWMKTYVIWLTGLPAAGKSTIARALTQRLLNIGERVCVLDGDSLRRGLCADLGFSREDRKENVRRVGEVAKLLYREGIFAIVALI